MKVKAINFLVLVLLVIVALPKVIFSAEAEQNLSEVGDTVLGTDDSDKTIPSYPLTPCRSGYELVASQLCISTRLKGPSTYMSAEYICRLQGGRVANYEDFLFICKVDPLLMEQKGLDVYDKWLGHITGDDLALYGNQHTPDQHYSCPNFEGETNRFDRRYYWCAHNLAPTF